MAEILENPLLAGRLGAEGHKIALERFASTAAATSLKALLEKTGRSAGEEGCPCE
jgi:hypothetical protein